jgi:hypothetical protein
MSKAKSIILISLLLLAPLALCLAQAKVDVNGDWDFTMTTQRGPMNSTAKFVQDGEKLSVTMTSERGEFKGEGTIKGADLEWTITRDTSRGKMTTTYKGKVDGNTMTGTAQRGDGGSMEWKATKKTS